MIDNASMLGLAQIPNDEDGVTTVITSLFTNVTAIQRPGRRKTWVTALVAIRAIHVARQHVSIFCGSIDINASNFDSIIALNSGDTNRRLAE